MSEHEPQPGEMHEIDQAFYKLTVKERDYERTRYDNLERLVREIGERHGFHWEPDCSPRSMLAKLSNRITLLERDKERQSQAMSMPAPSPKLGIATKPSVNGQIPVGWVGDFDMLTKADCEPLEVEGGMFSKDDYPELYAVVGEIYGKSEGETFQLPDLRGRVIRE